MNFQTARRFVPAASFVCLDESSAKTNATRFHGWGLGGARVVEHVPHGHWESTTMLAAIRLDGVIPGACASFRGAINGELFLNYVENQLAPSLRRGDVVIMDNLASHKVKGVAEAIHAADADLRYLPAYSPDLNPIEPMWSKVKALIRKAQARCEETLFQAIGHALRSVTTQDLQGFYKDAGYATAD